MNFSNMPELSWAYGYPSALAVMVLIDIYLVYRFKKTKWM
jgi:magnesium transporter